MEIAIALCSGGGLEMSSEWLLIAPNSVAIPITAVRPSSNLLVSQNPQTQQDSRGSPGRPLPLHSCHPVDWLLQITWIQVKKEPDGQASPNSRGWSPLLPGTPVELPSLSLCLGKALNVCFLPKRVAGRLARRAVTSYLLCSPQLPIVGRSSPFHRRTHWRLSDSAGLCTNGFWLWVPCGFYPPRYPQGLLQGGAGKCWKLELIN